MLFELNPGDVVIIMDLTRLSRSTKDLLEIVDEVKEKGANLKSLRDTWLDTSQSNPYSQFLLTIMSAALDKRAVFLNNIRRVGLEF